LFPVRLEDVPAHLTFHDAPEEAVTIGSATIRAAMVTHQGPTVGYRIEEAGRVLVYLPDHEPSLGADLATLPAAWMSGHDIARAADVLLHDGQYLDQEYGAHVGWGHSSIGDAMEFADKADVGRLVLFHHDPYHTDDQLQSLQAEARRNWPSMEERVCLACEGMTIVLDDEGVTITE
jgi:ribonuclease BN (tRNA processing enzyme)